jgi:hypothetical protein
VEVVVRVDEPDLVAWCGREFRPPEESDEPTGRFPTSHSFLIVETRFIRMWGRDTSIRTQSPLRGCSSARTPDSSHSSGSWSLAWRRGVLVV